jgi:hypothetical protein
MEEMATIWGFCSEIKTALITHPIRSIGSHKDDAGQEPIFKQSSAVDRTYIVGMFGFAMPHKGIDSAIRAISYLKETGIGESYRIKLMCACNGSKKTRRHIEEIQNLIGELGISSDVDFDTEFHDINHVHQELSNADCIVFPYEENGESASGAIREVVGLGKPIIVSEASIFDDFREIAWTANVKDSKVFAEAIVSACTSEDESRIERLESQIRYIEENSWGARALQFKSIFAAAMDERRCHMDLVTTVPSLNPEKLLTHGRYFIIPASSNGTRSDASKKRVTYFIHAPRTAGSSMARILLDSFPNKCSTFESSDNIYWDCRANKTMNEIRFGHISVDDIYSSYYPEDIERVDIALVTMLRNPVSRCASNLAFWWKEMNESLDARKAYMQDGVTWNTDHISFARSNLRAALEHGTSACWKYCELINPYTHQFSSNLYARRGNMHFEALSAAQENLSRFGCVEFFEELPSAHERILCFVERRHNRIRESAFPQKREREKVGAANVSDDILNDKYIAGMINEISKCDIALYRSCLSGFGKSFLA